MSLVYRYPESHRGLSCSEQMRSASACPLESLLSWLTRPLYYGCPCPQTASASLAPTGEEPDWSSIPRPGLRRLLNLPESYPGTSRPRQPCTRPSLPPLPMEASTSYPPDRIFSMAPSAPSVYTRARLSPSCSIPVPHTAQPSSPFQIRRGGGDSWSNPSK